MPPDTTDALTILFVDHARGLGGAERSLLALLDHLDPRRVRPVLATRQGRLAVEARRRGVTVAIEAQDRLRGPAGVAHLIRGAMALRRLARRVDADVVHGNVLRASIYAAAASVGGPPFVWHVRDIHAPGILVRSLCLRATMTVAISEAVAGPLPCPARVIFNPVEVPVPRPRSRRDLDLPPGGKLVAHVGRLRPWKGQRDFLSAAARVRGDATFLVIGGRVFDDDKDPDYRRQLEAMALGLGIARRVVFTGQREDLADIWPHVAVAVHTARAEPFGRGVAEAQAAGVPVVAYRDGGVPEIVADGQTGLLVPPGDVPALAGALRALLKDEGRRREMGAAGADRAARLFGPKAHARAMEDIYDQVAAGGIE